MKQNLFLGLLTIGICGFGVDVSAQVVSNAAALRAAANMPVEPSQQVSSASSSADMIRQASVSASSGRTQNQTGKLNPLAVPVNTGNYTAGVAPVMSLPVENTNVFQPVLANGGYDITKNEPMGLKPIVQTVPMAEKK